MKRFTQINVNHDTREHFDLIVSSIFIFTIHIISLIFKNKIQLWPPYYIAAYTLSLPLRTSHFN